MARNRKRTKQVEDMVKRANNIFKLDRVKDPHNNSLFIFIFGIPFNSLVTFSTLFSRYCIKLIYEVQKRVSLCISATFCASFQKVIQNTLFITQNNIIYSGILKY